MSMDTFEEFLKVLSNRSEFYSKDGHCSVFIEGTLSSHARQRANEIREKLSNGYLSDLIEAVSSNKISADLSKINESVKINIDNVVNSMTSEVGRAIIGLVILQMTIKVLRPEQNIRLHKGSTSRGSFSWVEGISMRTIDNTFITPTLRKYNLLKLNADGFMMTRSLAENYPYSRLYKAQVRGSKKDWLEIVDALENGSADAYNSLLYLTSLLLNKAEIFQASAEELISSEVSYASNISNRYDVIEILNEHIQYSDYAARLLEVGMHSLMQAVIESGKLGFVELEPLSQMRSANKKHGNIGDIELAENGEIFESWDGKYGKSYLRDEIDEITEKFKNHNSLQTAGFVTSVDPLVNDEIKQKIDDVLDIHNVEIKIMKFDQWVDYIFDQMVQADKNYEVLISKYWIKAYCETLAQRRRHIAPVDEPCQEWVIHLIKIFSDKRSELSF